jgi:large subunit ribosomal protein L3
MADINSKISKGMLGTKLGMTQVWNESGKLVPVTVIELAPNVVTQVRTPERDGYNAIQIAYGQIDPRKVNKPQTAHFEAAGVTPRRHLTEVRTADASDYTLGRTRLDAPMPTPAMLSVRSRRALRGKTA